MNLSIFNNKPYNTSINAVRSINKAKNNPDLAFTSKPIYNLNVKKLTPDESYKLVPATFSKLDPNDPKDVAAIINMQKLWTREQAENYPSIKERFVQKKWESGDQSLFKFYYKDFYAVEINDPKAPLNEKILSIATVDPNQNTDYLKIDSLQASPEILYDNFEKSPSKRPVKGAGELLLYGMLRQSLEKGGKKGIMLYSDNDEFYLNIGMNYNEEEAWIEYPPTKDDKFLKKMEDKYQFAPN